MRGLLRHPPTLGQPPLAVFQCQARIQGSQRNMVAIVVGVVMCHPDFSAGMKDSPPEPLRRLCTNSTQLPAGPLWELPWHIHGHATFQGRQHRVPGRCRVCEPSLHLNSAQPRRATAASELLRVRLVETAHHSSTLPFPSPASFPPLQG